MTKFLQLVIKIPCSLAELIIVLMETFPMLCTGARYASITYLAYNMCEVTLSSMSISRMKKHDLQSACDLSTRT
ncbi:unnamed protein product [Cylicocyclus nassatus]|uniref:Uncharacterized protein n=1 Tax=Cylicocyclus nassatus TaxID=53992 RepID=A0AA36LZ14_CYLNA|nr:unnamed protein product [Cylicocyclus nassatus]